MHGSHYIVITAIILLSIASIGGILTNYLKIPYTSMLVLIGLVVGIFHIFPYLKITPSLIYYVFLPIIIFEGAVNIKIGPLIANALPISILSIFGTIFSAIFIGVSFHFILDFPLKQSLIFGAIITPTDPISILALLKNKIIKKLGYNNNYNDNDSNNSGYSFGDGIKTVLEGESLFNDGISLVLFEVFLGLNLHNAGLIFLKGDVLNIFKYIFGIIGTSTLQFLYEALGGSILGVLLGYLVSFILSLTVDYLTEIMISLLLAYVSLIIAYYLNVSFIMAIIFGGIVLVNYGFKKKVSSHTLEVFPVVIEYMTFVINSILFLIIGIEMNLFKILNLWIISIFIIIIVILSRFIAIYLFSPMINKIQNKFKIFSKSIKLNKQYKRFLVFGGLRGALPIAMALSLPLNLYMRSTIITYVFITVLFSLTAQAIIFDIFSKKALKG
ncbi:MAG: cation:proton antiporter [Deltaproteobacteria bacterium]|nr:cation:proton antiporter [Deltaproteobacteria bacterium]